MSKTTKTPLRNHQRRPRLQEDFLETHRRLGISQAARAMKIDTHLPGCILDTSSMSKTTKTPLRNHQRPLRIHEDVLETHRRLDISQAARAMKIDTDLPGCI